MSNARLEEERQPINLLYIMGAGRSGSTLLDIVLGNHPQIESFGEIVNLPRLGWLENGYCSCQVRVENCPFWSQVRRLWSRHLGFGGIEGYVTLQSRFLRRKSWPRLIKNLRRPSPAFEQFRHATRTLYRSIQQTSGAHLIVDSSKRASLASLLSGLPEIEMRTIHLVRDVRGFVSSRRKRLAKQEKAGVQKELKPRPAWESVLLWMVSNQLANHVRRGQAGKSLLVRYEDFVRSPEVHLERVGRLTGLDFEGLGRGLQEGREMIIGHNVAGNRIRMQGSIRLRRADMAWTQTLSNRDQRLCRILAYRMLRQYRY